MKEIKYYSQRISLPVSPPKKEYMEDDEIVMNVDIKIYDSSDQENDLLTNRFLNAVKPDCAVCNKPVDSIECIYVASRASNIFIVKCHGAEEQVELEHIKMVFHTIEPDFAFKKQLLEKIK